jgi:hypothetical protein
MSAALAANSGSLLSHQDLRPESQSCEHAGTARRIGHRRRRVPWPGAAHSSRHSPAAEDDPKAPECVSPPCRSAFLPGCGLSFSPSRPWSAKRLRQVLTTRGLTPTSRAIAHVDRPAAASKTMRARLTSRCGVVGARHRASSNARSSGVSRTSLASGIMPILNHDSNLNESGY